MQALFFFGQERGLHLFFSGIKAKCAKFCTGRQAL